MMELQYSRQISAEELATLHFDIFIGASGFESRATHVLTAIDSSRIALKYALGFDDRANSQREDNDRIFSRAGAELVIAGGDSPTEIYKITQTLINSIDRECIQILVDYSSMTRTWYASVIKAIVAIANKRSIDCYLSYSPAEYVSPGITTPNTEVGPISGFCGLDAPDKPTALLVGLGYERDRALGLLEYVDPAICYGLITDPPLDSRYLNVVLENNAEFIRCVNTQLVRYPLGDLQMMSGILLSLYSGLRENYRIILAPLGVKPLSLASLLLSLRYGDIDVWRVTTGTKAGMPERKPLGPILTLQALFGLSSTV